MIKKIMLRLAKYTLKIKRKLHFSKNINMTLKEAQTIINGVYSERNCECDKVDVRKAESMVDLSIIVPVYNSQKYVGRCVESLINQDTQFKYEIILINDGSTDNTYEILSKYEKDSKVILINQQNCGISRTRNRGLEIASGMYVGFVDNDDVVKPNFVETVMEKAIHNNSDIVKCGYEWVFSDKVINVATESKDYDNGVGDEASLYDGYVWGTIYKKELWKNFKFPIDYWYEDMVFKMNLLPRAKKFCYIGECLYAKHEHGENASKKLWNPSNFKCLDQFFLAKQLIELTDKYDIEKDNAYIESLDYELGVMLFSRTRNLEKKYKKAVFIYASELMKKVIGDGVANNDLQRALLKRDYVAWRDESLYIKVSQMLEGQI